MRVVSHLAFAIFSFGTVAAPGTTPNATSHTVSWMSAAQQHAIIDAARSIDADTSVEARDIGTDWGSAIGQTLPEAVELHSIPRHETYRYAVVNDHRVIVDAASRRVVYVIP
jgi:hypothetical protein